MTRFYKSFLLILVFLIYFFLARLILYIQYHDYFATLTFIQVIQGFINGIRFDLSIFLTIIAILLLLINLPLKFAETKRWVNPFVWIMYFIACISFLFLLGDVGYFEQVKRHIGGEIMVIANDLDFVMDMALTGYKKEILFYLTVCGIVFLLVRKILRIQILEAKYAFIKFIIIILLLLIGTRGTFSRKSINIIDAFTSGNSILGNLSLNGLFTTFHAAMKTSDFKRDYFPAKEVYKILNLEDKEFPLIKSYAKKDTNKKYNIILFLMESWDFRYVDSFGTKDKKFGVTPYFDAMVPKGIKFNNFYSFGQRSIEGVQSTLIGIPSLLGLPWMGNGLEVNNFTKIGSIAQEEGYSSILIQCFKRRSYRVDSIAKACGFQYYFAKEDIPTVYKYNDPKAGKYGWDYDTLMFFKDKIDSLPKPFLGCLMTGTTHGPFPRIDPKFEKYPHSPMTLGGFLNTLCYADWSLHEFMSQAEKTDWFKDTIFIFTADHSLITFKNAKFMDKFSIPLLIYAPYIFKPEVNNTVGSHLDIMPTLMDLMNSSHSFASIGESLFRKKEQLAFVSDGLYIGLITDKGFLTHSTERRLSYGPLTSENNSNDYYNDMEKKMLAIYQLTYDLIESNKWDK
ncbi:MAG: Sulfatase protein [uncultured bacterium]|nr:MAG: Sulfatase protein [uncultured bacterium]